MSLSYYHFKVYLHILDEAVMGLTLKGDLLQIDIEAYRQ